MTILIKIFSLLYLAIITNQTIHPHISTPTNNNNHTKKSQHSFPQIKPIFFSSQATRSTPANHATYSVSQTAPSKLFDPTHNFHKLHRYFHNPYPQTMQCNCTNLYSPTNHTLRFNKPHHRHSLQSTPSTPPYTYLAYYGGLRVSLCVGRDSAIRQTHTYTRAGHTSGSSWGSSTPV